MRSQGSNRFLQRVIVLAFVGVGLAGLLPLAGAETITFSGTVSYEGSHSGDTLYVGVLDTTMGGDGDVVALGAFAVGAPPFSQPYSFDFDNAATGPVLFVLSFLDVDGGGTDSISGADVFGWYDGQSVPAMISSSQSASGLDFSLPRAEIHGTLTLRPEQYDTRPDATIDPSCLSEGFRPRPENASAGPYSIVGLYPGTYCVYATGQTPTNFYRTCYGDPSCESPTLVTLGETEVRTGINLNFTAIVPVRKSTWGMLKSRYP